MTTTTRATTTTTKGTTTTAGTEETTAGTTSPGSSPGEGRLDSGAAAAFVGELYAVHGRMVLGLCRLLLRDAVEAEDAAQQVFVSAQRALIGGVVPREPPAWLAAIARNECRARIRIRMREPLALPELPADIPDPLASAIHTADLDALWAALSDLPRRQRKAFLLRELGGLSYRELGAALGVTRPAVESLLFRARQQLRGTLAALNAVLVPVASREQLTRFLPLGTPAGGVPFGAKVAAVTVGVGLGAAGAVELPKAHHSHHVRARTPVTPASVAPTPHEAAPVSPVLAVAGGGKERHRRDTGRAEQRRARHDGDREAAHRAREAGQPAEPEQEAEAQAPEPEPSLPGPVVESSHEGDGPGGGVSDGGSGESSDSGGGGDSTSSGDLTSSGDSGHGD